MLNTQLLLQLRNSIGTGSFNIFDYGIAGALIIVIIIIFQFFKWITERENKRRDKAYADLLDKLNGDSKLRDEGYKRLVDSTGGEFKKIICDLTRLIEKTDRNYSDAIDKFIKVIKEQADSNSYLISELTKLQEKIEALTRNSSSTKNDILDAIKSLTLHYEIKSKV